MLGLLIETSPIWIERAKQNLEGLLIDHAHCELKAASNALSLASRAGDFPNVVRELSLIAEEELQHFRQVHDELVRRKLTLPPPKDDWYAAELRRRGSLSRPRHDRLTDILVDRLLIGSLIEARSCERFKLLSNAIETDEPALAAFYSELFVAEARHHRVFVELAEAISGNAPEVKSRLHELQTAEALIVERLDHEPTIHG